MKSSQQTVEKLVSGREGAVPSLERGEKEEEKGPSDPSLGNNIP